MTKRMLGLVLSALLAVFGTVVLVAYVESARTKAAAGEPTEPLLVVTAPIAKGTNAADLEGKVAVREVRTASKVDGAVTSAKALAGKVATTDLLPGEQVVAARFERPETLGRDGVPKGLLEVTLQLEPERALGGALKPGDTVAVVASFDPFDAAATGQVVDPAGPQRTPSTTHVILERVLVTHVQTTDPRASAKKGATAEADKDAQVRPEPAPQGQLLITLAVDASSMERIVFTAEYGKVWLSAQPSDAPIGGTHIETRDSVYR